MKTKISHYDLWEQELCEELQILVTCTYSDAHAILGANEVWVKMSWSLGQSPMETAKRIYTNSKNN